MNIDDVFGMGHGYMSDLWVIRTWCRRDFGKFGFRSLGYLCTLGTTLYILDRKASDSTCDSLYCINDGQCCAREIG